MPSTRPSAISDRTRPSRRRFLATVGTVSSLSLAGCSVLPSSDSTGDGAIEVAVENRTAERAAIAVRVTDRDDQSLFSHVFDLGPETLSSRGTLESTPATVHAFTATGVSHTWRYDPDLPVDADCEREDVGLTLHDDAIEPWYKC